MHYFSTWPNSRGAHRPCWEALITITQAVADTRLSDDVTRLRRVGFQFLPQLANVDTQVVRVLGIARPPDDAQQLLVRHYLTGVNNEKAQEVIFLGRKLNLLAVQRYQPSLQIDLQVTADEDRLLNL
jgi:hypothetical protein